MKAFEFASCFDDLFLFGSAFYFFVALSVLVSAFGCFHLLKALFLMALCCSFGASPSFRYLFGLGKQGQVAWWPGESKMDFFKRLKACVHHIEPLKCA